MINVVPLTCFVFVLKKNVQFMFSKEPSEVPLTDQAMQGLNYSCCAQNVQ